MTDTDNLDSQLKNSSTKDINFLRKILPNMEAYSIRVLIQRYMDLLIDDINQSITLHIGPIDNRYGCYGPYTESGKPILQAVMKYISSGGRAVITGDSYLVPTSEDFLPLESCFSPIALREKKIVDKIEFYRNFIRLSKKAVIFLNEIRTQFPEAEGCNDYNVPALGFIIHDTICNESNCIYLQQKETYSECYAPNKYLCEAQHDEDTFCPFHDSISIPSALRDVFLREDNRLIAVSKIEDLYPLLDEFV